MRAVRQVVAALLVACWMGAALAAPMTMAFSGTVSQTPTLDPNDAFGGVIDSGTGFNGRYTFDPTAPDTAADSAIGAYRSAGAPYALTIAFGSPGVFDVSFGDLAIGIGNGLLGADFYTFIAPLVAPDLGLTASLVLIDSDGSVFGSDALPIGVLSLDEFETRQFSLIGSVVNTDGSRTQVEILGALDTLACTDGCQVPEPHGLLLATTCLAALGALRLRFSNPGTRRTTTN